MAQIGCHAYLRQISKLKRDQIKTLPPDLHITLESSRLTNPDLLIAEAPWLQNNNNIKNKQLFQIMNSQCCTVQNSQLSLIM